MSPDAVVFLFSTVTLMKTLDHLVMIQDDQEMIYLNSPEAETAILVDVRGRNVATETSSTKSRFGRGRSQHNHKQTLTI